MTDLFVSTELIKRTGIYLRPYQNEAVEAVEGEAETEGETETSEEAVAPAATETKDEL